MEDVTRAFLELCSKTERQNLTFQDENNVFLNQFGFLGPLETLWRHFFRLFFCFKSSLSCFSGSAEHSRNVLWTHDTSPDFISSGGGDGPSTSIDADVSIMNTIFSFSAGEFETLLREPEMEAKQRAASYQ